MLESFVTDASDGVSIVVLALGFLSSITKIPFIMTILFGMMKRCVLDYYARFQDHSLDLPQLESSIRPIVSLGQFILPCLAAALTLVFPEFQLLLNMLSSFAGFFVPILICTCFVRLVPTGDTTRTAVLCLMFLLGCLMSVELTTTVLLQAGGV